VIDTEDHGLILQPKYTNDVFYLEVISDSKYTGNLVKQINVYDKVQYFLGAPITLKFNAANSITLSSIEAEYYASLEMA
jgi:hypothetical protein